MRYLDLDTGLRISAIGLGTWQFGAREWGYGADYDERVAESVVRRAVELGVTLFDTAEIYGMGRSERILGRALRRAEVDPGRVTLATKLFPVLPLAPVVEQRAVASAARLGVRRLDLYQVHQPNPVIRDRSTMRGMAALQDVGLVDQVGVSNYSLARWRAADAALGAPVLSNQVQYSLAHPQPEADLIPFAAAERRLVIAFSPLAQGLLSGRYRPDRLPGNSARSMNPLFLPENVARAEPLLATLAEVAAAHGATPAQVALAWVIRHPQVAAIPGAASVEQLEHNVAAAELELSAGEIEALSEASRRFRPMTGVAAVRPLLTRKARLLAGRSEPGQLAG